MLYDVVIVGSGISGLFAALNAKRNGSSVAVITKSSLLRSNSAVASGGINAVLYTDEGDSPTLHAQDTIKAAKKLAKNKLVQKMCKDAPNIINELIDLGVKFNKTDDNKIAQRAFGGGSKKRTCYVADKTGSAIVMSLLQACRKEGIEFYTNYQMLNLISYKRKISGISVLRRKDSQITALGCKALILAGGGYAGIYKGHTTNSQESSGDLIAAAFRAGIKISNMEFVQFHPTALKKGGSLISEAARGEGAFLVDETGKRFTDELSTRDILTRTILEHMKDGHKIYLDFRYLDTKIIDEKLPSTYKTALMGAGIDIKKELLEITPAAHYTIGGIWIREDASTTMDGVYACGECAMSGVHGANRLGGNSLLESSYFGKIAGKEAAFYAKNEGFKPIDFITIEKDEKQIKHILNGENKYNINALKTNLGETLFLNAGPFRSEESLLKAYDYISYLRELKLGICCVNKEKENNVELSLILEFLNSLLIAEMIVLSAMHREESRGVHYRIDYPYTDKYYDNLNTCIMKFSKRYLKIFPESNFKIDFQYKIKKIIDKSIKKMRYGKNNIA